MAGAPVALVTGGSRGLGSGVALALAAAGYSVAINYRSDAGAAAATAAACRERAPDERQRFHPVQGDVAVAADRERLLAATLAEFGGVEVLVNNAGIAPRQRADLLEASEESFNEVLATNLTGPYFLTQAVARHWLPPPAAPARRRGGGFVPFLPPGGGAPPLARAAGGAGAAPGGDLRQFHFRRLRVGEPRRVLRVQGGAGHGARAVRRAPG